MGGEGACPDVLLIVEVLVWGRCDNDSAAGCCGAQNERTYTPAVM